MRVFEIMTEGVQTVEPSMPAADAWELMRRKRIHHLVVTRNSDIAGILSDRDTGSGVGAEIRAGRTVGDLMTTQIVTARANDTIRSLANVMRGRTIGCAPVVDGKRLVGIVTTSDLLRLLGRGVDRPAKGARPSATHRAPHRKAHRTGGSW
jgi:CBS domain-containing protein